MFSTGTKTSSKVSGEVLDARMPCFSSPLPRVKPGVSFSTMKKVGPSGASASTVMKSA